MPMRNVSVPATGAVKVLPYNPQRSAWSIYNNGAATIYLSADPADVAAEGWPVPAGVAIAANYRDGDEPETDLFAIAAAGTVDVRVIEGYGPRLPT